METESAEYWRATDQVIALARRIILTSEVPTAEVDAFLDIRAELLTRVVDNLETAAYLVLAERLGFNLNEHRIPAVLLQPLDVFEVVPAVKPNIEDAQKGIYRGVQDFLKGVGRADDAVIPLYVEGSVSASAVVINGAMPVIVALIHKCYVLVDRFPPLTPEQYEARVDKALGLIQSRLQTWLRV